MILHNVIDIRTNKRHSTVYISDNNAKYFISENEQRTPPQPTISNAEKVVIFTPQTTTQDTPAEEPATDDSTNDDEDETHNEVIEYRCCEQPQNKPLPSYNKESVHYREWKYRQQQIRRKNNLS